mmetsp:Transcript_144039/g.251377  ORF Transcript_144039/g.251377 Transcript_144039/m.251377 type:complete len:236 (+) Transcript_144039:514-1221(+)
MEGAVCHVQIPLNVLGVVGFHCPCCKHVPLGGILSQQPVDFLVVLLMHPRAAWQCAIIEPILVPESSSFKELNGKLLSVLQASVQAGVYVRLEVGMRAGCGMEAHARNARRAVRDVQPNFAPGGDGLPRQREDVLRSDLHAGVPFLPLVKGFHVVPLDGVDHTIDRAPGLHRFGLAHPEGSEFGRWGLEVPAADVPRLRRHPDRDSVHGRRVGRHPRFAADEGSKAEDEVLWLVR